MAYVTANIHAPIIRADARDNSGELSLYFGSFEAVTFFTGNFALSQKLAGAINAAIAEHKAETEAHESFRLVEVAA